MIETASSGRVQRTKQIDLHLEESSMRTLEGGRMDAPTTGVCGRVKGSNGRGMTSPGRGGGSRGGGVAGSQMGRGTATPPRILPPCRVCGLTATGFHYGANTCEACKAFFRRMVGRPAPPHYSCQGNCQPDPDRGLSCPHCRLQRCLSVGMSLKAVKRGRYTHERKAQNILEVKQLSSPARPVVQQQYDINSNAIKEPSYSWNNLPANSTPRSIESASSVSPIPSPSGSSNASFSDSGVSPGYTPPGVQGFSSLAMQPTHPPPPTVSPREAEMDALVERMVAVHRKYDELKPEHFKDRVAVEAKYKEERKLLEEMFGSMKPLDVEEYCRIYTETGVDVDGRQQEFIQRVVPLMEHRMYAHCAFLKALPGFKLLCSQDQIALMKGSYFEDMFWTTYRFADVKNRTYYDPKFKQILDTEDVTSTMVTEFSYLMYMKHAAKLQSLAITEQEQVILRGICCLASDKCATKEGAESAEESQLYLTEALQRCLLKSHRHRPTLLGTLLSEIVELRELSHLFIYEVYTRLQQYTDIQDMLNPVLKEIFHPEGRVYEMLSHDFIKRMTDEAALEQLNDKRKIKNRKLLKAARRKRSHGSASNKMEDFTFFKSPRNVSKTSVVWSLRSDIFVDGEGDGAENNSEEKN